MNWTSEHHGVSHLGEYGLKKTWVTVEDYDSFAILSENYPGCGFIPKQKTYPDVAAAKRAGEIIMEVQK